MTFFYFKYKNDGNKALSKHDVDFLKIMDTLLIFADIHELEDLKCIFLGASSTSSYSSNISDGLKGMKIGSKISLDRLSGIDADVDVSEWFVLFDRLGNSVGWTNEILGAQLPSYLSDTALLIWKNMKEKKNDYESIKKEILTQFEVERSYLNEFCTRVQKDSESVVEFSQKLQWLSTKAELTGNNLDKQLLKQFWDGLNPRIKGLVLCS